MDISLQKKRDSFLPLIPELDQAIELLVSAANESLEGNLTLSAALIAQADMPEIRDYFYKIAGPTNPDIHWQSSRSKNVLPKSQRITKRMPTKKQQIEICERDGWRCRVCGIRVIAKEARDIFRKCFPKEAKWGRRNDERHAALLCLTASIDHVLPHSRGGGNDLDNVICTCGACNFGRAEWTMEEVGFSNPFLKEPIIDGWDGLRYIVNAK